MVAGPIFLRSLRTSLSLGRNRIGNIRPARRRQKYIKITCRTPAINNAYPMLKCAVYCELSIGVMVMMQIFMIIGTNANAANLRTEFSMPPSSAVIDTKITYGMVMRHRVTAKSNLSVAIKPGAMSIISHGMASCMIMVRIIRVSKSRVKIFPLNIFSSSLGLTSFSLNIGMKTAESAPSPNIRLNRFGNLNATFTQSAIAVVPNVAAMKSSRARPKNLDSNVKNATIIPDLKSMYITYLKS